MPEVVTTIAERASPDRRAPGGRPHSTDARTPRPAASCSCPRWAPCTTATCSLVDARPRPRRHRRRVDLREPAAVRRRARTSTATRAPSTPTSPALDGLADLVFAPTVAEMYPRRRRRDPRLGGPRRQRCSRARRGPGTSTGCSPSSPSSSTSSRPDVAVFGQKDAQQVHLVGRMVDDLEPRRSPSPSSTPCASRTAWRSRAATATSTTTAALRRRRALAGARRGRGSRRPRESARMRRRRPHRARSRPSQPLSWTISSIVDPDIVPAPSAPDYHGPAVVLVAARVGTTRLIDNERITIA